MKILENSSRSLVIYSRPIELWIASALFPILGIVVGSYFLEITSFKCKQNESYIGFCQTFVIQTNRTQIIGIEIKQNKEIYKVEFITTDQYPEFLTLGLFFLWMNFSLYYFFFKIAQTRTCKFDKTINQLIIETKGLLGKKIAEYSLNEISDVVIFNGITTKPVYLILNSDKRLPVYVALDSSIWHQKAQDTVDLIKIFLGLFTKVDGIEKFQINSSSRPSRLCRIIYRSQFFGGHYITSIDNMPVKYDFWRRIISIGEIIVKYSSSFLAHEHISSIGDVSIKYDFWERIIFIGEMPVKYSSSFLMCNHIISIGDMIVKYDLGGHINAIGDIHIQCDSYGQLTEIYSSTSFSIKQLTVLFLLAKLHIYRSDG